MSVCPLSNCSIAWNSISVGSLTQSQYSEGERIMLALSLSLSPLCIIHSIRWEILPMLWWLWWGQYCCLVNIFIKSKWLVAVLDCCDGNKIITSEISDVRDEMINFYSSDCDENQSEISDSSDFIVFPNIKWSSS